MRNNEEMYDVIVVGGGPAGMTAAGRAAALGASVLLLEKNAGLGKKLLISGGGRSNVTNAEFDTRTLLKKYGTRAKFLHSPFAQFDAKSTFDFFESHGMPIKIEAEKRAFPKSDTARSVLEALEKYMAEGGVVVKTKSEVASITHENDTYAVLLSNKVAYNAKKLILSTGGMSHPETGSTGDGFNWLEKLGHMVGKGNSALVPICTREKWGHTLSGLAFTDARVSIRVDGKIVDKKQDQRIGKILFTHVGLSGPLILNMSKHIGEAIEEGVVTLAIDIFPKEDRGTLDRRLRTLLDANLNKKIKNVLREFIPASLVDVSLAQNQIDGEREVNALRREERAKICAWWKEMIITPTRLMGADKAVVTSGGVDLAEIDMRTMESKKHSGLYVIGDVLDIDRPSGGYSLQLCWTTGYVAGTHAGEKNT
jgi:predicted Rossmann fold flavoprotein